ncbi:MULTISPECIES: enoyl-CoA hydratase/isomerase family protein [Rhodococcus]|uniref:Enoyl-CoA hydratase/isomerase family protein n=1 Tax=Rhodococcus pseudokoreensis TaxID=2811421 RepID=A0A974ZTH6_9NOCA|nr:MULTISPECIES: enoyl-CoA hydratase-related protein [Rhodococcus]MBV6760727.1 enoyl-CoA hydratase/isomerase family protein [Rhodococcus opacus]QSE89860.1 enoyl-CoA hydratase/isomerase family protein [Rhodococcus pseudokoreensis]
MDGIRYAVEDGVATITLDRPTAKNAFTLDMVDMWAEYVQQAHRDPAVGALVLTGAGDAFCAGGDLSTISDMTSRAMAGKEALANRIHRVAFAMEAMDKPTIAAVNGVAVGAGMDMALMCDIRFMARSARMGEGYVKLGLVPGDGGAYYLPRIVGTAKALELLLTGDFVDADEALRIGLVARVVDDESLLKETQTFAARLAAGPPLAIRMIKRAVYRSLDTDLRTSLDLISSHMGLVATSEDAREAIAAMKEKRTPMFTGR